ncbi:type I glyceraldehyde-3-phosphate dehydrogenase [Sulfitobacter geojensis]|jgi:glyceraldehyde 3-phosphate dehydrogenase|uniref:Glyceraldehyde-3-phosphate dehydrogenase n=1 Tax=Sulfitobacter geojensis TaxID=1342299 RepID=A0AAE2W021_9RHOB|nr:type I glyceraldehyde-3-phosphate dehydrogenase [Sulfitobacter geojensis]MBM1690865.1 type I glyceraldehyde-3-phosphate dehydrogenase [Sulfitobacter geojensis]MBM1694931.1 type I glyceraldehyde-3-phosphate dehydrogenase [Sulfitobacter geojensis]MBM1706915.1 type I glyceraldehyde-3-phosphate dehydrogenase [Sulfitobacter geojensis]MBM1710973.1 type I glyceraldehyde-3-phosphate dehydrogenase [Sulfitobacter geojensis]MBM1715039.1 type I glyceraldehyde-3-phosphate dehydrogenase [Sulfitobacter ge
MTTKVAINGFGRIGRCTLRAVFESGRKDIEVVAINDLAPVDHLAHLLKYDSVHGTFQRDVSVKGDTLVIDGHEIRLTAMPNPAELPWGDVDVALECTGRFNSRDQAAAHLENGSKRVLVSAPASKADRTVVYGVNHDELTGDDVVVSNASCTTNCLAPVAKVLDDAFGLTTGYMTTIHAYTGDQPSHDRDHSDLYRARACALSMIPTSTGAARAISLVLPHLEGRLEGSAIRVPTANVSLVDLSFMPERGATVETVNAAIQTAANGALKGVLGYEEAPLVSSDFNHNPMSSIFAPAQTSVTSAGMVRVVSWYDNEWGFSNRMLDTAVHIGGLI